jgi:hypothetical protein
MVVREILREYSTRSTYFSNPYEDPGEEFEIDSDDPVGLVDAAQRTAREDEIRRR